MRKAIASNHPPRKGTAASVAEPSVVHSTFSLERTYRAAPARVFQAFADETTKRRWFAEGEGWEVEEFTADFRVGGREFARFRFKGGPEILNHTTYQDIVTDRRIVFAYTMTVGEKRISASLATVQLLPTRGGTNLIYTEQGAFFDDADALLSRQQGWGVLLERLEQELRTSK
jgi:uncharacterized protein YndB with AHSA1/START domain